MSRLTKEVKPNIQLQKQQAKIDSIILFQTKLDDLSKLLTKQHPKDPPRTWQPANTIKNKPIIQQDNLNKQIIRIAKRSINI